MAFVPYSKKSKSGVSRIVRDNYGPNWYETCARVRKRDNGRCIFCGAPEHPKEGVYHEVHHLRRIADGGTTTMSNLGLCCQKCHDRRPGHSHMKAHRSGKGLLAKPPSPLRPPNPNNRWANKRRP